MKQFSAIILSAGLSKRMQTAKAFLKFTNGKTFIEHIASEFIRIGASEVVVVVNTPILKKTLQVFANTGYGIKTVENTKPELGRFYSAHLGTSLCAGRDTFIHNVDNPFINANLLYDMMMQLEPNSYVSPRHKSKGGHPILLSREVVGGIAAETVYNRTLNEYISRYKKIEAKTPYPNVLVNINTPDEYNQVKSVF